MNRYASAVIALLALVAPMAAASQSPGPVASEDRFVLRNADQQTVVRVNCNRGETITHALAEGREWRPLAVQFSGTCHENPVINRDDVDLSGTGSAPLLIGLIDVRGSSRVAIHDFNIQGDPSAPFDLDHGGVNVVQGSSATVTNIHVSTIKARGFQVDHSAAVLNNLTVDGGMAGAFVFRASQIFFQGSLVSTNSLFGMSLVYTWSTAKGVNFTFDHDVFALLVQAGSTFEHIEGKLVVNNSTALGIGVFGQGVIAYGSFIEAHNNQNIALEVDELSSFSPLIGAPGGGPSVTITDNPAVGISVERGSTFELATAATIERNNVGLQVDGGSYLRMANATISGNPAADVKLSFGSKAEFNGGNAVATPVQCDSTVLTRGTFGCGGH